MKNEAIQAEKSSSVYNTHACPKNIGVQTIVKNQLTASCEARVIIPKIKCDSPHGPLANLFLCLTSKRSRGRYCNHSTLELSPGIKFMQLVEKFLVLFVAFCTLALQKQRIIELTQSKQLSVNADLEEAANKLRLPPLGLELWEYVFQSLQYLVHFAEKVWVSLRPGNASRLVTN